MAIAAGSMVVVVGSRMAGGACPHNSIAPQGSGEKRQSARNVGMIVGWKWPSLRKDFAMLPWLRTHRGGGLRHIG